MSVEGDIGFKDIFLSIPKLSREILPDTVIRPEYHLVHSENFGSPQVEQSLIVATGYPFRPLKFTPKVTLEPYFRTDNPYFAFAQVCLGPWIFDYSKTGLVMDEVLTAAGKSDIHLGVHSMGSMTLPYKLFDERYKSLAFVSPFIGVEGVYYEALQNLGHFVRKFWPPAMTVEEYMNSINQLMTGMIENKRRVVVRLGKWDTFFCSVVSAEFKNRHPGVDVKIENRGHGISQTDLHKLLTAGLGW